MGTISSAFNLIAGALDANQGALDIVANNVANANTTGYTREVPNWQENPPVVINGVAYGNGVMMTGPTAVRDRVLEQRLVQQQQLAAGTGAQLTALNTLQSLFTPNAGGSTSSGAGDIGGDITSFFNSFSSLEANPTNDALRQQVLSSATVLASDVSSAASSLSQQQAALDQQAAGVTTQVNALSTAIAKLNTQIQSLQTGGNASALEDQRQQDLSQLSQLIGIHEVPTENNGLSVTTTSGQLLLSQGASFSLTSSPVNGVTHFFLNGTDVTQQLASGGGSLGGYLTARDVNIPNALSSLDQLAYSVSTAVNTQNNAGTDLAGDNGGAGDIFYQPSAVAGSAATMRVVMTDPNHIAAAANGAGTGDNSNATAMADLAKQGIVNGESPTNFFAAFVSQLGAEVQSVQTENTAQNASVTQLQSQRDTLSGVNLNDEAAAMQQYERSYQAASQVFALLNTVLSSAINMGVQTAVA